MLETSPTASPFAFSEPLAIESFSTLYRALLGMTLIATNLMRAASEIVRREVRVCSAPGRQPFI